jgi:hypothetical protein
MIKTFTSKTIKYNQIRDVYTVLLKFSNVFLLINWGIIVE